MPISWNGKAGLNIWNEGDLSILIIGLQLDQMVSDYNLIAQGDDGRCRLVFSDITDNQLEYDHSFVPAIPKGIELQLIKEGPAISASYRFGTLHIERATFALKNVYESGMTNPQLIIERMGTLARSARDAIVEQRLVVLTDHVAEVFQYFHLL